MNGEAFVEDEGMIGGTDYKQICMTEAPLDTTGTEKSQKSMTRKEQKTLRTFAYKKSSVPFLFSRREIVLSGDGKFEFKHKRQNLKEKAKG